MFMTTFRALSLAALVAAGAVAPAAAQDKVTFKISHGYPASHFLIEQGVQKFADAVSAATGGAVAFELYPANQLGKDHLATVASGIAELALVTPAIAGGKLPLTAVSELPGLANSSCEYSHKFWELAKEGGILNEAEYKPQDLHVIYVSTVPPYSMLTATRPTPTLDAVSGLKIRVAGGAMNKTVTALGGAPVQIPGPEMYDALTRGTVDGSLYSHMALAALKLEDVMKYSTSGVKLGAGSVVLVMSAKAWDGLSDSARAAITEAGAATLDAQCSWQDEQEATATKRLVEEKGWEIAELSPEQVTLWTERIATVNEDWAKELDGAGRPGTEVLNAFRAAAQ